MYVKKTETRLEEVTRIVEDFHLCDKCNAKINVDHYDSFKFNLTYKEGYCYPEGGSGTKTEMELCPNCAEECIELLKLNGYRMTESEWDI